MRFLDGPLAGRGNVPDATGAVHTFTFPDEVYGWPLPERLCVLAHLDHTTRVAIWNPEAVPEELAEIADSPNRVTYLKVNESPIADEQAIGLTHIVRGAEYRLA